MNEPCIHVNSLSGYIDGKYWYYDGETDIEKILSHETLHHAFVKNGLHSEIMFQEEENAICWMGFFIVL
ncbi:MAG TPA: hypothetical protein VEP90_03780 [Methylomirabilota bacterium]|nr:hypothetical protein [Methylomirabilota bacterium]